MEFKSKLKELMQAAGLTEKELAGRSGVTYGAVHAYAIGRRAPSFENVIKLARALGTDCTAFAACTFPHELQTPTAPAPRRQMPAKPKRDRKGG
jgi:transcriptional regulator with XRE-family HTH domain